MTYVKLIIITLPAVLVLFSATLLLLSNLALPGWPCITTINHGDTCYDKSSWVSPEWQAAQYKGPRMEPLAYLVPEWDDLTVSMGGMCTTALCAFIVTGGLEVAVGAAVCGVLAVAAAAGESLQAGEVDASAHYQAVSLGGPAAKDVLFMQRSSLTAEEVMHRNWCQMLNV